MQDNNLFYNHYYNSKLFLQINNRNDDISIRGPSCLVYDYNGTIVKLIHSFITYNSEGDYIPPRAYIYYDDCDLCSFIF